MPERKQLPILSSKMSRRELVFRAGAGFSGLALAHLLDRDGLLAAGLEDKKLSNPLAPKKPHFEAKAKSG